MPGNALTGLKLQAADEARWLIEQIAAGKMALADVCDLLSIPDEAREVWLEAAARDYDLAVTFLDALVFRNLVADRLGRLLGTPLHATRQAKIIQRSGKREPRLPVARENLIAANTAAQDERSHGASHVLGEEKEKRARMAPR